MAVATYTCSVFANNGPKSVHVGVNPVRGKIVHAGTVGDILFLAKVPHGADIIDFYEYHSNGQTAAAYSFGFDRGIAAGGGGNASCILASAALATHNRLSLAASPTGEPLHISLSDLDPVRYATLQAKAESGTFTISNSIGFCLLYSMDRTEP